MAATGLNPLSWNVPIVDGQGRPTPEFMQAWKQQRVINGGIPDLSTAAAVSAAMDVLYSTPGGILVRGSSLWGGLASPADPTKFLNGANPPTFGKVHDTDLSVADVTGNNVSISAHGFAPKLPNDATKFLNGLGAYSVPAGGGASVPDYFGGALAVKPLAANFTLAGSTTLPPGAAISDGAAGMHLSFTSAVASRNVFAKQAISSTPFTITMMYALNAQMTTWAGCGIVLSDPAHATSIAYLNGATNATNTRRWDVNRFTGGAWGFDTNNSDSPPNFDNIDFYIPQWMRVKHDGTNLNMLVSNDGVTYRNIFSQAANAFLTSITAAGPCLVMYDTDSNPGALRVFSWGITYP